MTHPYSSFGNPTEISCYNSNKGSRIQYNQLDTAVDTKGGVAGILTLVEDLVLQILFYMIIFINLKCEKKRHAVVLGMEL